VLAGIADVGEKLDFALLRARRSSGEHAVAERIAQHLEADVARRERPTRRYLDERVGLSLFVEVNAGVDAEAAEREHDGPITRGQIFEARERIDRCRDPPHGR
jgi:hypothetical protein